MKKEETRKEALRLGLRTAQKPESQDLCLVEHYGSMQNLIDIHIEPKKGEIRHINGEILGTHNGIQHFTFWQFDQAPCELRGDASTVQMMPTQT